MTIAAAFAQLRANLLTVNPSPQPALRKVLANPAESFSLADVPLAVITLAPGTPHAWGAEAIAGRAYHRYTARIYVIVGARATGLPELHARALAWPEPLAGALLGDITLSETVVKIGDPNGENVLTYTVGPIKWGDGDFFGLTLAIPIEEKPLMDLG